MPVLTIAAKEFKDALRNRWLWAAAIAFMGLAVTLTVIGSAPAGEVKGVSASVVLASLASLSVYLVPLVALLIAHDAIVSEREFGTLMLLLTYPVPRIQIFLGKFLGNVMVVGITIFCGYGAAILALVINSEFQLALLAPFLRLFITALIMGSVFIALGMIVSLLARQRATAVGVTVGLWLLIVVIYDLALLGILIADTKQLIDPALFSAFLMLNPADAFRTFNIAGIESVSAVMGLTDIPEALQANLFLFPLAMVGWLLGLLIIGCLRFQRYEI